MFTNQLAITTPSLGLHPCRIERLRFDRDSLSRHSGLWILSSPAFGSSQFPPLNAHKAARLIGEKCSSAQLGVLALNPFKNFEGHISPITERLNSARHYIETASCLGAKYLQVPSQFDTDNSAPNWDLMVQELRQLCELAASHSIMIAYEAVTWGSYIDTWEGSLRMVENVNRSNFGVCLDSFHIAARVWADCTTESGIREDGESELKDSLDRFVETCPLDKIFYVQLSDAERFVGPLTTDHRFYQAGSPSSLNWSRNMRLFPLEEPLGAYLPVLTIADALLKRKGWKGVVSLEVFDWRMREEASRQPNENAKRGIESWKKLVAALEAST
ncbi:4-hydroxyphenylpyruvate dioxygenase [Penicillium sp. IBT 18751x]|nr:4-hydroxyphenylpyruvate dioxygenase [Penicillium sp. IBT 18751x]